MFGPDMNIGHTLVADSVTMILSNSIQPQVTVYRKGSQLLKTDIPVQVSKVTSSEVAFREQWESAPHKSLPLGAHSLHAKPTKRSLALKEQHAGTTKSDSSGYAINEKTHNQVTKTFTI